MNEVYCKECGKMHTENEEFYKNEEDGTVLCKTCFEKLILKGDIK